MEEAICSQGFNDPELDPQLAEIRNALYNKYVAPYYDMIYKLCINYSYKSANVQENYNEVLINFYRRIQTYDPNKSILTWLHIVTKRQVAELERRRVRHNRQDNDSDIDSCALLEQDDCISQNVMDLESCKDLYNDEILAALQALKPIPREAFLLQEAGYTLKEIADIQFSNGTLKSRNIETVKSRLFLARQFLKQHLTRDGKRKTN